MLNPSVKRQRQDDSEEPHEPVTQQKKKPRPLPLRTSPVLKHIRPIIHSRPGPSLPTSSTLTPNESSDDDTMHDAGQHLSQASNYDSSSDAFSSMRAPYEEPDSDFEMADSQPRSATTQPLWSAGLGSLRPETSLESPIPSMLLNQSLNVSGGRTATPIFSHFTSNMNTDSMMKVTTSPADPQRSQASRPSQADAEASWWRRRRLPSPISEDETQMDPRDSPENRWKQPSNDAQPSPGMYTPAGIRISVTPVQNDLPPSGFAHGANGHAFPFSSLPSSSLSSSSSSSYNSSARLPPERNLSFGHSPVTHGDLGTPATASRPAPNASTRSGNNNQRPQKLTIAMGFRADCEKCQQRVPGHYSHIIRA